MLKKLVLFAFIFAAFMLWYTKDPAPGSSGGARFAGVSSAVAAEIASQHEEKVILYATDWCGYCRKTRDFLEDKNIAYYEYNIEKSKEGRGQYRELKGRGVPLLVVNGRVIRGYNTSAIVNALEQQ